MTTPIQKVPPRQAAPSDPVLLTVSEGVAQITLNRPHRLNSFDAPMAEAWLRATRTATHRDDVRAILISGNGRSFCAGGDVQTMAHMKSGHELTRLAETINEGLLLLLNTAIPVIAAVHGTTAGGGLGILLASDYAVAADNSRFGALYGNIGLTPDLSVTAQLSRAIGERRALQLVLRNELIPAQQALDWGLIAEMVSPKMTEYRARVIAAEWSTGPAGALGTAKNLLRSAPERSLATQLHEEAAAIGAAFDTVQATALIAGFAARPHR